MKNIKSRIPLPKRYQFDSKLLEIRDLTPTVKEFVFETLPEFDFYAGQFVTLKFQLEGRKVGRAYSIASSPQLKGKVALCIKLVEDGLITPKLFSHPKSIIDFSGPMGRFFLYPEHLEYDLVFIGTGTGIAPHKSMVEDIYHRGFDRKITILAGVRHIREILYADLWTKLSKIHSSFQYLQMVSRPEETQDHPSFYVGRVGDKLPDLIEGNQLFVICGLKEMINTVTDILKNKGIPDERILFEKYD